MAMRTLMLLGPLLLAACATGADTAPQLTEKQTQTLEKELAGKVPGEKVSCISQFPQTNMRVISNQVLLYKVNSKLIYKNELLGSCSGLSRGDTLITKSFGSQLCRGDIAHTADLTIGTLSGSCALGDFIPYRTPKG
jgi:hypothetical protein